MFTFANAFNKSIFCNGFSLLRSSDFASSGVTDFSCGDNKLRNINVKDVVDDLYGTDDAKKTTVLDTYGSIENWDVSRITNMNFLFQFKSAFNANISAWQVGKVTTMAYSTYTFLAASISLLLSVAALILFSNNALIILELFFVAVLLQCFSMRVPSMVISPLGRSGK